MNRVDLERLAAYSDSVRDSSLRRLRLVPSGVENNPTLEGMMSAADIADHLIESDQHLLGLPTKGHSAGQVGVAGQRVARDRDEYEAMIEDLVGLRHKRRDFILNQSDDCLAQTITFDWLRGQGRMDLGSMIYRVLDHETHHRGAIIVTLRVHGGGDSASGAG